MLTVNEHVGFTPAFRMGIVSVGGCHHCGGRNSWMGEGAPAPPPGSRGLRHFSIELPNAAELERAAARIRAAGIPAETTAAGVAANAPEPRNTTAGVAANATKAAEYRGGSGRRPRFLCYIERRSQRRVSFRSLASALDTPGVNQ